MTGSTPTPPDGTGSTVDPGTGHSASSMPRVERLFEASVPAVWDVLSDGWLYPLWVVGTARIRDVEPEWPQVGAKLHHSFGTWPVLVDDETEVLAAETGRMLRLRARGWPIGEAQVDILLEAQGDTATKVTIAETAVRGPGRLVPQVVESPLMRWRNTESLRRLALLAEGRAAREDTGDRIPPRASDRTR
jgi:hypothetical protein